MTPPITSPVLPPEHIRRERDVADKLEALVEEQEQLAAERHRALSDHAAAVALCDRLRRTIAAIPRKRKSLEDMRAFPARAMAAKLRHPSADMRDCVALAQTIIAADFVLAAQPAVEADLKSELAQVEARIAEMEAVASAPAPKPSTKTKKG